MPGASKPPWLPDMRSSGKSIIHVRLTAIRSQGGKQHLRVHHFFLRLKVLRVLCHFRVKLFENAGTNDPSN